MHEKLADEVIAASKNEGEAVKKRETMHKIGRSQQGIRALCLVQAANPRNSAQFFTKGKSLPQAGIFLFGK